MCDPITLTVVAIGVATAGSGTLNAIGANEARQAQKQYAKKNARLQRYQIRDQLQQETEANAQKNFELARQLQVARGAVKATNLADRSVRAIARSIGFEVGTDKATIAKNQEIANKQAAARLAGVDITLAAQKTDIGSSSGTTLALDITGAVIKGAMASAQLGSMLGIGQAPGALSNANTSQLDASVYNDLAIA